MDLVAVTWGFTSRLTYCKLIFSAAAFNTLFLNHLIYGLQRQMWVLLWSLRNVFVVCDNPMTYFFFFPSFGLEKTSKTPHYETTLVPATSEAPATHVVPPTSVHDQATTVSSVTLIVQATHVFSSTPEDVPATIVSPVTPEAQATRGIQSTSVQVSATSVLSVTPEAQISKHKGKGKQWRLF